VTDPELIAKKLALIETCVRELQTLSRPTEISRDFYDAMSGITRTFCEETGAGARNSLIRFEPRTT
jgi:hypothetical protein